MWIMVWCEATIMVWECLEEGKLSLGKVWTEMSQMSLQYQYNAVTEDEKAPNS